MTCSILGYNNWCHVREGEKSPEFIGLSGTWVAPVGNLGWQQPGMYASFASDAAIVRADYGEEREAQVFAVVGHTLPVGSTVGFYPVGAGLENATVEVEGPGPVVAIFDEPVSVSQMDYDFRGTGGGARIGVLWASPACHVRQLAGWGLTQFDTGVMSYSTSGEPWSDKGRVGYTLPIRGRYRTEAPAWGFEHSQLQLPGEWDTDKSSSHSNGTYEFSDQSGMLMRKGGFFGPGTYTVALSFSQTLGSGTGDMGIVQIHDGNGWVNLSIGDNTLTVTGPADLQARVIFGYYTGIFTWDEILRVQTTEHSIKRVLDYSGTTEPVLWLPRLEGEWPRSAGTYGHFEPGARLTHLGGPVWEINATVRQAL